MTTPSDTFGSTNAIDLSDLGNVPTAYRHEWRVATPQAPLIVPGAVFKWHHVHRDGVTVPEPLAAEARETITDAAASGAWDLSYGLNICQIHVSTAHAFLIPGVWRGHQELWQRPYVLDLAGGGPFSRIDTAGGAIPAACVWEFGVICHERMAWHSYLFSARDDAAKRTWLADTYAGRV